MEAVPVLEQANGANKAYKKNNPQKSVDYTQGLPE
jgi:hypothetical protein